MGLLSILKKMKQKEKDVRLLMLYPYARFCSLMILLCVPSVVVLQLAIRLQLKVASYRLLVIHYILHQGG